MRALHGSGICFNLLRRYAVIPTAPPLQTGRFNLLDMLSDLFQMIQNGLISFQSPTEICSHSDARLASMGMYWPIDLFQSPTEICSHSDLSRPIGARRPSKAHASHSDATAGDEQRDMSVSISYGDMQSFRRKPPRALPDSPRCFNLLRRYAVIPTVQREYLDSSSDASIRSFNLLRRYAVIPT